MNLILRILSVTSLLLSINTMTTFGWSCDFAATRWGPLPTNQCGAFLYDGVHQEFECIDDDNIILNSYGRGVECEDYALDGSSAFVGECGQPDEGCRICDAKLTEFSDVTDCENDVDPLNGNNIFLKISENGDGKCINSGATAPTTPLSYYFTVDNLENGWKIDYYELEDCAGSPYYTQEYFEGCNEWKQFVDLDTVTNGPDFAILVEMNCTTWFTLYDDSTCNYAGNEYGPLATDNCGAYEFDGSHSLFSCDNGLNASPTQHGFVRGLFCDADLLPFASKDNINGVCNNPTTGCTVCEVELFPFRADNCDPNDPDVAAGDSINVIVTDGADGQCVNDFNEIRSYKYIIENIYNGYEIEFYDAYDCVGTPYYTQEYFQGGNQYSFSFDPADVDNTPDDVCVRVDISCRNVNPTDQPTEEPIEELRV